MQPGDGAIAMDELQDNKKLKVGAVWSLHSGEAGSQWMVTDPGYWGPELGTLAVLRPRKLLGALPG